MSNQKLVGTEFVVARKRNRGFHCTYHKRDIEPVLIGKQGINPELACPHCLTEEFGLNTLPEATYAKDETQCASETCTNTASGECSCCKRKFCALDLFDEPGTPCLECKFKGLEMEPTDEEDEELFSKDQVPAIIEDADGWTVVGRDDD